MLILTRKAGEKIFIGNDIEIQVLGTNKFNQMRIGITAPPEYDIVREEIRKLSTDSGDNTVSYTRKKKTDD